MSAALVRRCEIERLKAHVADLQSGMFINCVYCGHRYGPSDKVPAAMADVLKAHVEKCPQHPMSTLRTLLIELVAMVRGECPSLLDEDSGGDSRLSLAIDEALSK